jgi:two-component system NtrC family sensor kinase
MANSSRVFPVPPIDLSDRDYFIALRDGHPGAFISKVYPGRATGAEQFNVARRRSSSDATFNGVIDISDSRRYFEAAYEGIGNDAASVVLARDDGDELAYHPKPMFSGSRAPADLIAKVPQSEPLFVNPIPRPHDGTDQVGVFQRIRGYPLFVGYSLPAASITAGWRRTVTLNGMLVVIGSISVAFMGWLVLRGFRSERAEVQRREQAEAKMEQARRMEVIGQLTAGVAHDFNNLLSVISGNLELLPPSQQDPRVEAALSATARGERLIRQMLTFARRQVLNPEMVDVNAELRRFDPLVASAIKNLEIDYQLTSKPTICCIDRAEFEFAILNIATNARHAMPRGGRLEIDTEAVQIGANGNDGMRDLAPGTYLRIAFIDNGKGMSPDVLARAFEPFFTTREAGAGTGLGLSQVYGFAKQSGGLATVESAIGRGTTVIMYLPLLEADAVAADGRVIMDAS